MEKIILILLLIIGMQREVQCQILSADELTYYYLKADSLDKIEGIYNANNNLQSFFNSSLVDKTTSINIRLGIYKILKNRYGVLVFKSASRFPHIDSIVKTNETNYKFYFNEDGYKSNLSVNITSVNEFDFEHTSPTRHMGNDDVYQIQDLSFQKQIGISSLFASNSVFTGSGFVVSNNGFLVTNNHVIDGAKVILIKSNINKKFIKATVVAKDVDNDLAILKVSFDSLGLKILPSYKINSNTVDIGSEIFVLGFPLITSMGFDLKLTNGIISAQSGYSGDQTLYQISAPIQPGNSGGPLFDSYGNLDGIVNAKLSTAENVGYAIKSSYLISFLKQNNLDDMIGNISTQKKSLTENFKTLKNFTFTIICYN